MQRTSTSLPAWLWLALLWAVLAFPVASWSQEPEPFRGDEIDGREFEYDFDGFLQRYSYDFHPRRERSWLSHRTGARATVGSVSSGELYVFEQLRLEYHLRDPLFFEFRHLRAEDFDTRYDRTLTGFGLRLFDTNWTFTALSEVVAEKSVVDLQLETAWQDDPDNRVRLALNLTDFVHDKSNEFDYSQRPYTLFAEGRTRPVEGLILHAWANFNPYLRREQLQEGFDFTYWQFMGGLRADYEIGERWVLRGIFEGLVTDRSRRIQAPGTDPALEQRFSRRHLTTKVEALYKIDERLGLRGGFRYFRLSERDDRQLVPSEFETIRRRDFIGSVGVDWRINRWIFFWPTLFLDVIDNREGFPNDPMRRVDTDERLLSKLNLPVGLIWGDISVDVNTTLLLHEGKFGGGNVQVQIPF